MAFNIKKLNPWNWLKKEEEGEKHTVPVIRRGAQPLSTHAYTEPLFSLHQEIARVFDNAFRSFRAPSLDFTSDFPSSENNLFYPKLDIESTDEEYRISVELPGVVEKDVNVELNSDGTLVIKGDKKQEREEKKRDYHCIERSYGSFQRVLSLPEDADEKNIKANFSKGILTIRMPRKILPKAEVRRISVDTSEEKKLK